MGKANSFFVGAAFFVLSTCIQAQATRPNPIYDPSARRANITAPPQSQLISPMGTSSNGSSCTLITFEGLGDVASIPNFYGIGLPSWLSIIQNSAGGTGNIAKEPSPVTVAFWLYGNPTSQTINIPNGASQISLYYSSSYAITLSAYDASGKLLTTVNGSPNYDSATGVYDVWSPLTISAPSGTTIASLSVSGYANYTAIDNLDVCQSPQIAAVEVTQAIQKYQTLSDLKTSLASGGKPPVPIVAGKRAVLRAYLNQVEAVSNVTLNLSGVSTQSVSQALQPNCSPADQRSHNRSCPSIDFYFTPPPGSWTATLNLVDSSGNNLATENLPFTSVTTDSMRIRGVAVCDSIDANGNWQCGTASDLLSDTDLLAKIAPTASLTTDVTTNQIKRDINDTNTYPVGTAPPYKASWWLSAAAGVDGLFGLWDRAGDLLSGRRTTYFGMLRNDTDSGYYGSFAGLADSIPSHGALSFSVENWKTLNMIPITVAHEVGHTLGGKHTNTPNPAVAPANGPPGCWDFAHDSSTYWPYADNYIQTGAPGSTTYEVPFDVAAGAPLAPQSEFEIMSYCAPGWVSPQTYLVWMNTLGGGKYSSVAHAEQPELQAAGTSSAQPFWQVSGSISGSAVAFDPLFQVTVQGDTGTDTGTYSLQVRSSTGTVLFTRLFTPTVPVSEPSPSNAGSGSPADNPSVFSQLIPVTAGAAAIVLLDPTNTEIGRVTFTGTAPTVSVTSPTAGSLRSGTQPVIWTVSGATTFYSKILYSPDNGTTWSIVGEDSNKTQEQVNFDLLPGSTQALIRVLVSDGVNSASATSATFTVPKKKPSVAHISTPTDNSAQPAANAVYLSGSVYDVDDGVLSGSALQWSDNLSGSLGTGSPLSVTLKPGAHVITLTGTDSDGNTITATTNILLGGQPPVVSLTGQALNAAPTTCEFATVSATPGSNGGAPLSLVQYSVDGGSTYTTVPLASLPYGFLVQGTGFLHLIARAYDVSGQSNAQDATFFIQSACGLATQNITFSALANQTYGVSPIPLTATSSSGLPVSYTLTGPATLSGSTITITGTGTVTVTAMQAGNSTYAPASWVSHSFTVSAATPTITWAAPAAIVYGTSLGSILNASAFLGSSSVTGTYAYSATLGNGTPVAVASSTVLSAGTYTLSVLFNPANTTNYNSATGTVPLTIGKATPTIAIASSANPVLAQTLVSLTATITSSISIPTGSMSFLDGSTSMGSATLANGSATLTTSGLSDGPHSITAVYSGDANYGTITSGAVTVTVQNFTLAAAQNSGSQSTTPGGTASFSLIVSPTGGTTIPAAVTLTASGLPISATATFSPTSIASGAAATTVTLSITVPKQTAMNDGVRGLHPLLASTVFGMFLLLFSPRLRRGRRILTRSSYNLIALLAVGIFLAISMSGCVGSGKAPAPTSNTYNITVNATSGSLVHSSIVTLTVTSK